MDSVTTVPETFSVAGSEEALNNLKLQGNTIYLDNENVDISGKSNDVEKKVNLSELLPDGLKRTSGSQSISCRRAVRYTASRQRISK